MKTQLSKISGMGWLFFLSTLFGSYSVKAQNFNVTEIFFTTSFVWEYVNETIPEDEIGYSGEFQAYYDIEAGYWAVLNPGNLTGGSGEMANWIVMKPDGNVVIEWMGEFVHERPVQQVQKVKYDKIDRLPPELKPSNKTKEVGFDDFHVQLYAEEYHWSGTDFMGSGTVMLSETPIDFWTQSGEPVKVDFTALYNYSKFNETEVEFPVKFTDDIALPGNFLMTEMEINTRMGSVAVKLKSINWANKLIYLKN